MAAAAGIASNLARRRCSSVKQFGSVWPTERNPRYSPEATRGTESQERKCLCALKVCQSSSLFVSGIRTLFCPANTRCKNGDSSDRRVSGVLDDRFGGSGHILSPSASQWGPPSGTKTRAQVYGTSSER